jgi:hypothetical protein
VQAAKITGEFVRKGGGVKLFLRPCRFNCQNDNGGKRQD